MILILSLHGAFERTGGGALSRGLGEAYTAFYGAPDSIFFNLAGISLVKTIDIDSMYAHLYSGLENDSLYEINLMTTLPLKNTKAIALAWNRFHSSLYQEDIIIAGYSQRIVRLKAGQLLGGAGLRTMRKNFGENEYTKIDPLFDNKMNKTGFSMDAGLLFVFNKGISLGASIQNITEPDLGLANESKIFHSIRIGSSFILLGRDKNKAEILNDLFLKLWKIVQNENSDRKTFPSVFKKEKNIINQIIFNVDGKFFNEQQKIFLGGQMQMFDFLILQMGYGMGSNQFSQISFGTGVRLGFKQGGPIIGIHYSFVQPLTGVSEDMIANHFISLNIKF